MKIETPRLQELEPLTQFAKRKELVIFAQADEYTYYPVRYAMSRTRPGDVFQIHCENRQSDSLFYKCDRWYCSIDWTARSANPLCVPAGEHFSTKQTPRVFHTLEDLAKQAIQLGACEDGLARLYECRLISHLWAVLQPGDLIWLALNGFVQVLPIVSGLLNDKFTSPLVATELFVRYPQLIEEQTAASWNKSDNDLIVFTLACFTTHQIPKHMWDIVSDSVKKFIYAVSPWRTVQL